MSLLSKIASRRSDVCFSSVQISFQTQAMPASFLSEKKPRPVMSASFLKFPASLFTSHVFSSVQKSFEETRCLLLFFPKIHTETRDACASSQNT